MITKAEAHKIMSDALSATERKKQDFLKKHNQLLRKVIDREIREMAKKGNSRVSFSYLVDKFRDEFTFKRVDYDSTYDRIEEILEELDYDFTERDSVFRKRRGVTWETK